MRTGCDSQNTAGNAVFFYGHPCPESGFLRARPVPQRLLAGYDPPVPDGARVLHPGIRSHAVRRGDPGDGAGVLLYRPHAPELVRLDLPDVLQDADRLFQVVPTRG